MTIYKSGYILSADRSGCFLRKRPRVERVKKPSLAKLKELFEWHREGLRVEGRAGWLLQLPKGLS